MTDPSNPVESMADVVRGLHTETLRDVVRGSSVDRGARIMQGPPTIRERAIPSVAPEPSSPTLPQVLQAWDEIGKRLDGIRTQSVEVRSALTRATPPDDPKQSSLADLEGGTIFDQMAARAVMISRIAEEIERNLALSLSALR